MNKHCFASDNYAGMAPQAWRAMEAANQGYADAYGDDLWTLKAADKIREVFESDCEVFFAFNGTASNALSLAAMCQSYHSVICHSLSHIETHECGAPEFFSNGSKLLTLDGAQGKLQPDQVEAIICSRSDMHFPKPKVISLTQCTELGSLYTQPELLQLRAIADRYDMHIHMDGARFANAVSALGMSPAALSWQAGVDALCLGGSKNGMAIGDAIVFFNRSLAQDFDYRCKQAGQLASKMRYISAPWVAMLEQGVWLDYAQHANDCAQQLAKGLQGIRGITLQLPVETNGVFVSIAPDIAARLRELGWKFYDSIGEGSARLMCSWATTDQEINAFCADAQQVSPG